MVRKVPVIVHYSILINDRDSIYCYIPDNTQQYSMQQDVE